jgi:hypothetical protein
MSAFPSKEHKTILLAQLRTLGIKKTTIGFSGGGDSGDIDSVEAVTTDGRHIDINKHMLDWPEVRGRHDPDTNAWIEETKIKTMSLDKILEQLTLDTLQDLGIDWYNNDGGQGSLTIDFSRSPPEINLDVGINHMVTEDYTYDLNEEDDDAPMSP